MKVGDMVRHTGVIPVAQRRHTPETEILIDIPFINYKRQSKFPSWVYPNNGIIVEVRKRLIKVYWNDSIGTILHPRASLEVISESR